FSLLLRRPPPPSPLFPYTTLFRSPRDHDSRGARGWAYPAAILVRGGIHGGARRHPPERHGSRSDRGLREARRAPRTGLMAAADEDRKSTRLNSSHVKISYAVFCLK